MSLRVSTTIGVLTLALAGLGVAACGNSSATTTGTGASTGTGGTVTKGPGAALKCDSSGKDAFDTYGATAFVAVNEAIFAGVTAEISANSTTNLGDSFTKIGTGNPASTADDAATFKGNLAAFLVYAYGGPTDITYTDGKKYHGPQDMVEAHTGLAITGTQYDYFITNIVVPALTGSGVKHGAGGAADPDDVGSCFAPIVVDATFKGSIVGH